MVTITIDGNKRFQRAINRASRELSDLRIPLNMIAREWFKSNKAIFTLQGYGKYEEYSDKYETWKKRRFGKISILKVSGALEKSITDPTDKFSVNEIINKKALFIGTKVLSKRGAPYAVYLQNGTKFMPARPAVLFGHEQVAPRKINRRIENWALQLEIYCLQKSSAFADVSKAIAALKTKQKL